MPRTLCVLLFIGSLAFAQEGSPSAPAAPEGNPARQASAVSNRRVTTVRRSARAGNKPRQIKMQKLKNMPKFKKPRKF